MTRILFVDDEAAILDGLRRMLRPERTNWEMVFVQSAEEALGELRSASFDTIVSDVNMPGMDGLELIQELHRAKIAEDVPIIVLTGNKNHDLKRRSLDLGATDLLNKPVGREDLIARLRSVLRLKSYQDEIKSHNELLERRVIERTAELADSRLDVIWRLGKAAECRDEETGYHIVRVGCYCRILAQALGMDHSFSETIFVASPLHDIGKIGIPDGVLLKRGSLTREQRETMQGHCAIGAAILRDDVRPKNGLQAQDPKRSNEHATPIDNPMMKMAASIALTHHEKWNGTGYPAGLAGEAIPIESRIAALADVFDALCSERPYKPAFAEAKVLGIMSSEAGRHFDPVVFKAFERSLDAFRSIRADLSDEALCLAQQECAP